MGRLKIDEKKLKINNSINVRIDKELLERAKKVTKLSTYAKSVESLIEISISKKEEDLNKEKHKSELKKFLLLREEKKLKEMYKEDELKIKELLKIEDKVLSIYIDRI